MTNKEVVTPRVDTVVEDIYDLFRQGHTPNEDYLNTFATKVKELVKHSLESAGKPRPSILRMSNIGTPDRKLWYTLKLDQSRNVQNFAPKDLIKFLYGHLVEELLLLFVKCAGHTVSHEQEEVTIAGVPGHRDCKIDGVPIDVKSASKFSFAKFSKGSLKSNDPFGYIAQISAYTQAGGDDKGGFLAINKEDGELALLLIDPIDMINVEDRISSVKDILSKDTPPDKCFPDEPYGASGNMGLNTQCIFCPFKDRCWQDANNGQGLRKFKYAGDKVEYLTKVVRTPSVPEI